MKIIDTDIDDVKIVEPDCFGDHRGFFMKTYSKEKYKQLGINNDFIQNNLSCNASKGTLRGIHF